MAASCCVLGRFEADLVWSGLMWFRVGFGCFKFLGRVKSASVVPVVVLVLGLTWVNLFPIVWQLLCLTNPSAVLAKLVGSFVLVPSVLRFCWGQATGVGDMLNGGADTL